MTKYIVYVERKVFVSYQVEADTEEEAIKLYQKGNLGDGDCGDVTDEEIYAEKYDEPN